MAPRAYSTALVASELALILSACSTAEPASPAPDASPAAIVASQPPTATPSPRPSATPGLPGVEIPSDKNVLVLSQGLAQISHDNGLTWSLTDSGQWVEPGDEIQLTEDAIALIFFFNGSVVRLEGPTDSRLLAFPLSVAIMTQGASAGGDAALPGSQ